MLDCLFAYNNIRRRRDLRALSARPSRSLTLFALFSCLQFVSQAKSEANENCFFRRRGKFSLSLSLSPVCCCDTNSLSNDLSFGLMNEITLKIKSRCAGLWSFGVVTGLNNKSCLDKPSEVGPFCFV